MQEFTKGDYTIYARWAYPGDEVYNYLEDCEYVITEEKCIVLQGTVEEEWVVTPDKLASTYVLEDGREIDDVVIQVMKNQSVPEDLAWIAIRPIQDADAPTVFAYQPDPDEQVEVETSWGEVLTANRLGVPHGNGDWIVFANDGHGSPNEGDSWIVNGAVFETTYVEV